LSKIITRKILRGMSWAKHLALIGQGRSAYIVLEGGGGEGKKKKKLLYQGIEGRILKKAKIKLFG